MSSKHEFVSGRRFPVKYTFTLPSYAEMRQLKNGEESKVGKEIMKEDQLHKAVPPRVELINGTQLWLTTA